MAVLSSTALTGITTRLADASMSAGSILQVVSTIKTDTSSQSLGSGSWWSFDDSSLKVTLTPSSASNKILILGQVMVSQPEQNWIQTKIQKGGSDIAAATGDAASSRERVHQQSDYPAVGTGAYSILSFHYLADADDTNSRSYNYAFKHTSGSTRTIYINRTGSDTDNAYYGRGVSTITAMEVAV